MPDFWLNCHTGTMKVYADFHRVMAAVSFMRAKGEINAALADFTASCAATSKKLPKDARAFVLRWGQYYKNNNHVMGDAASSGRKPKLSKEDATLLVADIMNWAKFGLKGPFSSIGQLKKSSPKAKEILEEAAAAPCTIIKALKKIEPKLAYKKLTVKQKLTRKQRIERVRVAEHHVQVSDRTTQEEPNNPPLLHWGVCKGWSCVPHLLQGV